MENIVQKIAGKILRTMPVDDVYELARELLEKNLSEWSKEELENLAKEYGVK